MRAVVATVANPFDPVGSRSVVAVRRGRRVRALAPKTRAPVLAVLNGRPIMRAEWGRRVGHGDVLVFTCLPRGGGGGSNPLRTVLSLALMVAAPWAAGALLGTTAAAAAAAGGMSAFTFSAVSTGIALAGQALLSSLMPIPQGANQPTPSPTYTLQAQGNAARLEAPIPVHYGRLKRFPDLAAAPYASFSGNEQYTFLLLCLGRGEYVIEDILVEDTPTSAFPEIETEIVGPGEELTLFPAAVTTAVEVSGQDIAPRLAATWSRTTITVTITTSDPHDLSPGIAVRVAFTSGTGPADGIYTIATVPSDTTFTLTTATGSSSGSATYSVVLGNEDGFVANAAGTLARRLAIDLVCPRGLYGLDGGDLETKSLTVMIQARRIDDAGAFVDASWTDLEPSGLTLTDRTATPIRRSKTYVMATPGRYKVRVWRSDARSSDPAEAHDVAWVGLRAFLKAPNTFGDVTLVAVKMRATNSLSSLAQRKIAVIATRKLRTWDGTTWSAPVATRSIAWAIADIAQAAYGGKLPNARIDRAGLLALDAVWNARGDHFDFVFDQPGTIWAALLKAAAVGRARPYMQGGKLRVVRDAPQTLPVAHFGMRNIVKGSFSIGYLMETDETADSVQVAYFDSAQWKPQRVTATLPGSAAAKPAKLTIDGITGREHALREGFFQAASNRYRRRIVTLETEMEGFIPALLDLVSIQHDMPGWGAHAEATSWDAGALTLGLTEPLTLVGSTPHYVGLRRPDGSLTPPIRVYATGAPLVLRLAEAPDFNPRVDGFNGERTHVSFGKATSYATMAKVRRVVPKGLHRVQLELIPEDPAVHLADADTAPRPISTSTLGGTPKRPAVSGLRARQVTGDRVVFSWRPAAGASLYLVDMASGIDPFDEDVSWTRVGDTRDTNFTADLIYGAKTIIRVQALGLLPGPYTYATVAELLGYFWSPVTTTLMWSATTSTPMWSS